jgi:hypothetical protein
MAYLTGCQRETLGVGRNPGHDHAWDNGPFAVLLLASAVETWGDSRLFCDLEPQARKALDFVNRSSNHLVYNDPVHPNCVSCTLPSFLPPHAWARLR